MIGGADGDDATADGDVLVEFVAVAHRIEERRIVVEIEDVEVDGHRRRQTRTTRVLRLHHEDEMLHLKRSILGSISRLFVDYLYFFKRLFHENCKIIN